MHQRAPKSRRRRETIAAMPSEYERLLNTVLSGHAAYRTQLFLYLEACGRTELGR